MTKVKVIYGTVLSNSMQKTVVVGVERRYRHPRYGKYVTRTTKLYAHDEENIAQPGVTVALVASRPLSRLKRWRVLKVVSNKTEPAVEITAEEAL
jgi:small subunit ribosomal protein S17